MIHYLELDINTINHILEDADLKKFIKKSEKKLNNETGKSEVDYKSLIKYREKALDYKELLRLSGNEKLNKKYCQRLNKLIKAINKLLE